MSHSPERAFEFLSQAWQSGRLAHCWLISGQEQYTQALAARFAAQVLGVRSENTQAALFDGLESSAPADTVDGQSLSDLPPDWLRVVRAEKRSRRIGVEAIRALEGFLRLASPPGQWKIAVIVAADRFMPEAANAFLKTMEEPPDRCLILLLTQLPQRLLTTVRSRCVKLELQEQEQPLSEAQETFLGWLTEFPAEEAQEQGRALAAVGVLRQKLLTLLDEAKARLLKEREQELRAERKQLGDRAESSWVAAREEQMKAQAQADYLHWRAGMVELLGRWLGDCLRQSQGAQLQLPEYARFTQRWAETWGRDSLLQRLEALEKLEQLLETNVNEGLLWEVSLLEILG